MAALIDPSPLYTLIHFLKKGQGKGLSTGFS